MKLQLYVSFLSIDTNNYEIPEKSGPLQHKGLGVCLVCVYKCRCKLNRETAAVFLVLDKCSTENMATVARCIGWFVTVLFCILWLLISSTSISLFNLQKNICMLRPNSSNLPCLYSTFHLEYPLVLSRFCFVIFSCFNTQNHLIFSLVNAYNSSRL